MKSKVILFCALFLCSKFVASIPFGNEELSQQRAYPPRNWQGNQNTDEQHHGSGFARTQNVNSMTKTAQQFENGQEYNSHHERQHYENQGNNNQATLLHSLPSKDSQVNFAQTNERRLENFPTRRDPYPKTENHPVRVNNPFMSHNWENRFANSAQSATASVISINEKPLVTVNEPYHGPGQQHIQFRPPVHKQSQQQVIHQRQAVGLYPVTRDVHYQPIADKSDNIRHVEQSGTNSRVGPVRYVNYNEAHAHSSSIANSGNNAYIQKPRSYVEPVRSQHFETYNEPAAVKPEMFKHVGGNLGHPGPTNNGNRYNDGRVIPANTGFNNEHNRYIENPLLSSETNNNAYNGYQAPIAPPNKGQDNIGNFKYLENPKNSGYNHPAPLHAYRNDKIPVMHSGLINQVPSTLNGPVAPIDVPKILDEPDNNGHEHNPVIYPGNDNQVPHTYNTPEAPVEIPTILDEPDNQGSNTNVPEAPVDESLILDGAENDRYEQNPVLYSGQEDDNTYNAPIDTPETYDESVGTRNVKNPLITPESNYPAPMDTNEPLEPIENEKDNSPHIHDYNKDSYLPIDKFLDNLDKSGEKLNINSFDREKMKAHLSKSKKNFVLIDIASGKFEFIDNLQRREPPNYVVVKKDDTQGGNLSPPSSSQPSNPLSEEPEPPVGSNKNDYNQSPQFPIRDDYNSLPEKQSSNINQNDYNSSPQFPVDDDYNPLLLKQPPNNNKNDYNPSPQFPIGDDYNPLPVKQPLNNNQNYYNPSHMPLSPPSSGYNSSPQFSIDDDYKQVPLKQPPNNSDYKEPPIQQSQSDNDNNSPSELTNHNKPLPRPQKSNDNNYNPTYEPQYPNVYSHHNYHHKPQRPPHVHGHQYRPFNPTWENYTPGSPSKLHTHVYVPTSTTPVPVPVIDEDKLRKLHTHVRIPTSTTPAPAIDEDESKEIHTHAHRPTSTTPEPAVDEEEPTQLHRHKHIPTSTTPAPEIDEEKLKKYLDRLPKNHYEHHKPSSTTSKLGHFNDDNDNSNNNDKSHSHKSSKAHTTSTATTTTESDEFIKEFLESLSKQHDDSDEPCEDDNGVTTPKPSDPYENHSLNNVTTTPPEDKDQIITLSPIEQATDNVRDDSPHHLHHNKVALNTSKSETTTKVHYQKPSNHNQSDDKVSTKNKKHDCSDDDTSNPVDVEKPNHLHHDTLARNASKSKTSTKSHSTLKSSNQNQSDDKDSTKNKKHDCSDDDTDEDVKEDTKKSKTKTACNDSLTNTDVPAEPDDNSAAETNSENRDDVNTSDSNITRDYLLESPTSELKITVSIPNDSDGTVTINVEVPDSTGDEYTSGEDLVVSFETKNSSETSKQSTHTTDNSQGWDQNKNMVLDLSNAVVLMNRTSDRDYLSQLMPNNSSLTVFIIEMPHQDKALVESYKETKIYPNGTCVEETKKTTWKNEHDQVPTVVTTRKIYSCE